MADDRFELVEPPFDPRAIPGAPPAAPSDRFADRFELIESQLLLGEQLGATRREARLGSIEQQLGAPLARTETGAVRELEEPLARADLSRNNETQFKVAKLQEKFPEMEIVTVDDPLGGQVIALRAGGEDEYILLDSSDMFTLSDVADIGGHVANLETLGTIASTIATRGRGLMTRAVGQFAGGAGGRAADIALEQARGFEQNSLTDISNDSALSGGLAATGELAFAPFRAGARMLRGRGAIRLTPEEQLAEQTARDVGIEGGLTVGQVQPLAQRMEQQAAATSKRVQQRRLDDMRSVLDDMKRMRDAFGDFSGLNDTNLDATIRRFEDDILKVGGVTGVDPLQGGKALKAGRQEYVKAAKAHLDRKYTKAIAASQDVEFNLTETQVLAREMLEGTQMRRDPEVVARQLESARAAKGADLTPEEVNLIEGQRISIDPEGSLAKQLRTILDLDPSVRSFNDTTAFEQIKTLRTQLFDLKNAAIPGQESIENRQAGQLWDALTQAMEKPTGGSDEFVALYRAASLANRRKEAILDVTDLRTIGLTSDFSADQLVRTVARPYNGGTLRLLSRVLPPEQWETFKQSFKGDLLARPERINSRLDEFRPDPRALRALITPDEEAALRLAGNQYQRLNTSVFRKSLQKIESAQARAVEISEKADAGQITEFLSRAGGKDSEAGRALRGGTIQALVNTAGEVQKGVDVVNPKKAISFIQNLDNAGKLDAIFNASEVAMLRDRRALLSFMSVTADPGASIQAAELGAQVGDIVTAPIRPRRAIGSFINGTAGVFRNAMIGRLFISPTGRKLLVGASNRPMDLTTLRALAAVGAELTRDIDLSEFQEQPEVVR